MASHGPAIFLNTIRKDQTRLMASATTACGPQVEEVQALDFHESPVNQEIITEHYDQSDDEMSNGFRGYKWSSFILNFRHELLSPLSRFKILKRVPD